MLIVEYFSRFCFEHHIVVDPLHGRAAGLADDRREVFGRQVQLFGIEPYRTLLHVVPGQHSHKLVEYSSLRLREVASDAPVSTCRAMIRQTL